MAQNGNSLPPVKKEKEPKNSIHVWRWSRFEIGNSFSEVNVLSSSVIGAAVHQGHEYAVCTKWFFLLSLLLLLCQFMSDSTNREKLLKKNLMLSPKSNDSRSVRKSRLGLNYDGYHSMAFSLHRYCIWRMCWTEFLSNLIRSSISHLIISYTVYSNRL